MYSRIRDIKMSVTTSFCLPGKDIMTEDEIETAMHALEMAFDAVGG